MPTGEHRASSASLLRTVHQFCSYHEMGVLPPSPTLPKHPMESPCTTKNHRQLRWVSAGRNTCNNPVKTQSS